MKKWVILIALQFRYIFYRPQITRLRARKIGLQYKIPARRASVTLQATAFGQPSRDVPCASEDMACGSVEFQNGEQQSRSGSDKKRRNRLQ